MNFSSLEDLPEPKNRQWAVYLKPTSACNLSCVFCYNPKKPSSLELFQNLSGLESFQLFNSLALQHIVSGNGENVHLIWHGGEFLMMSAEWLSDFLTALRRYYPRMAMSGMSNLQAPDFSRKFQILRDFQVGLSTSRNIYVDSANWREAVLSVLQQQRNLHFNTVFDGMSDTLESIQASEESFEQFLALHEYSTNHVIKFERLFPETSTEKEAISSSEVYQKSSELICYFLEKVIAKPEKIRRYLTFLFPYLYLEFCRRTQKSAFFRGFFCGSACYRDMLVIDQELRVGLCTKAMAQTEIGQLSMKMPLSSLLQSPQYYNLLQKIFETRCSNSDCEYSRNCFGSCPFLPEVDSSGECGNSSQALKRLQQLSDSEFYRILEYHPWKTFFQ